VFLDRVAIVAEYDTVVHSPSRSMRLPSVVALRDYRKVERNVPFTRYNLFLRDRFTCQYCGAGEDLTFDHLVPRSKGGITTWENVVTACSPCNLTKGGHLPGEVDMWPENLPVRPTVQQLHANGRMFPPNYLHESWADFLYWDTVLEP